ncbi:MAG: Fis family transcriptional regulator [Gammaproteobacteria bacterium]|nr:Fis family transcriptional regulator [Gammaproteobacteria bacterium]
MTAAKTHKVESIVSKRGDQYCLSENVRTATENYFADLDGHEPKNLYDLFLAQVEKPLIEVVMHKTRGNVTKAAQVLGLNRGTLRSRLKKYGLD